MSHGGINLLKQRSAWPDHSHSLDVGKEGWPWIRHWHYKANSEIHFRSPRWTGQLCRLVSLIICSMLWLLQHCSYRKPFRSRDVIYQRLGIKSRLSEAACNRWMLPHQLTGISITMVGSQNNLQLAGVCQFLVDRKIFKHLQMFLVSDTGFTAVLSLAELWGGLWGESFLNRQCGRENS